MNAPVAELVEKALLLSSKDRSELVEAILEHSDSPEDLLEEQMKLVEERMEKAAAGKTGFVAEEQAHQFVMDSLRHAQ